MAHVRKRNRQGRTVWQARWATKDPSGNRHHYSKDFARQADAKAHVAKVAQSIEMRGVSGGALTFGAYLDYWTENIEARGVLLAKTLQHYRRCADNLKLWAGGVRLDQLSAADLDRAYSKLKTKSGIGGKPLSGQSCLHVHRTAHRALEQARKWKMVSENVAKDAEPIYPEEQRTRALSDEEQSAFLDALQGSELLVPAVVMATTGLRRGELLGLRWADIDEERMALTVCQVVEEVGSVWRIRPSPKTRHGRRLVSIGEQTLALLQQQRARVAEMALQLGRDYDRKLDLIFPGPGGAPLRPSYLSGRLAAVRDRLGLPKDIQPCHGWRHSHATELVGGGLDPAAVSKRLGHSTVAFTLDRYVHPNREKDRQAAEIGEAKLKL